MTFVSSIEKKLGEAVTLAENWTKAVTAAVPRSRSRSKFFLRSPSAKHRACHKCGAKWPRKVGLIARAFRGFDDGCASAFAPARILSGWATMAVVNQADADSR
jgi:hypothetical protein